MQPWGLGATEIARLVRARTLSPVELVESLLRRIDVVDPALKAWVTVDAEGARAQARNIAERSAQGRPLGSLGGVPIGLKDIFYTKGLRTTASSRVLADFVPEYDATVVALLRRAGAIVMGKLHTAEFASRDPAPTRNPWDPEHTPGGSSAGSGAAVAAGMVPVATGSQTGGSVLRPAAYNGVVGLKPTYGLVSCHGVIPLAWTLDHVGFLARCVEDAALVLEACCGYDANDPDSARRRKESYHRAASAAGEPPTLGLVRDYFMHQASPEVRQNVERVAERFAVAGARILEVRLPPSFARVHEAHRVIMTAEMAAYHEPRFKERADLYGPKIAESIREGLAAPVTAYARALRERPGIIADLEATLRGVDALLTPTTATPAPRDLTTTGDAAYQVPWSYSGLPTISLPSGLAESGLPLGIQLIGGRWRDAHLLRTARWCEVILEFNQHPPAWRVPAVAPA